MRLSRDEFYGHVRIQKLATAINKKTKEKQNNLLVKEPVLIQLLKENEDWLDYIGLKLDLKNKKSIYLRWDIE